MGVTFFEGDSKVFLKPAVKCIEAERESDAMTMKISGLDPRPSVGVVPSAGTRGKPVEGNSEHSASGRPNVEVSTSARRMADLETRVAASSGINEAKVEAIRLALERGEYQVDSKKIADQLLKLDWEIGKASGRV